MNSREQLENFYTTRADPWNYASDPYELGKYAATLAQLPCDRYGQGLEIGCSEGVFTRQAAPRLERLLAVDVSSTAVERARARTADLPGVTVGRFDFIREDSRDRFDVIFCSEVLYYIPPWRRLQVARKIARWLAPGGHLVLVHTWREYTRAWDHVYGEGGAERLHRLFTHVLGMPVVAEEGNDDYVVTVVRAASPVFPLWRRCAEFGRLTMLALIPTAGAVAASRLRAQPRLQRLLRTVGRRRDGAAAAGEDHG